MLVMRSSEGWEKDGELVKWTEEGVPVNPEHWINAGLKLNLLKEPLNDQIIALQSSLANKRLKVLRQEKVSHTPNL